MNTAIKILEETLKARKIEKRIWVKQSDDNLIKKLDNEIKEIEIAITILRETKHNWLEKPRMALNLQND